jgi:hypothetical protein
VVKFKVFGEYEHCFGDCWQAANQKIKVSPCVLFDASRLLLQISWRRGPAFALPLNWNIMIMGAQRRIRMAVKELLSRHHVMCFRWVGPTHWVLLSAVNETNRHSITTSVDENMREGREWDDTRFKNH